MAQGIAEERTQLARYGDREMRGIEYRDEDFEEVGIETDQ